MANNMNATKKPIAWSIAASDNSGGAGIQADNLSFHDFGVFAANIVTAVTAQNSRAVGHIEPISLESFSAQWQRLQAEYPPAVIKLGMLGSSVLVASLIEKLKYLKANDSTIKVVCDPVLSSTSGTLLAEQQDCLALLEYVDVLTPNQQEFAQLFAVSCNNSSELEQQALQVAKTYHLDLIITGGESSFIPSEQSSDLCVVDGDVYWLHHDKVTTLNTHGTGCSFASSIAASLALGLCMRDASVLAKAYLHQGLSQQCQIVESNTIGPFQHAGFPSAIKHLPYLSRSHDYIKLQAPVINEQLGLYPVVDSVEWLERCLKEGVKTIQLRVKDLSSEQAEPLVKAACELGRQYQARLFINDYWQLAIKYKAYGIHLGQEDLDSADVKAIYAAGIHLGISTHAWYELARAYAFNPSYIAIGPVFATTTKQMPFSPQGLSQLKQWVDFIASDYPVVAIGGIDAANASDVVATGVGSIAMVRAITEADDYPDAIAKLQAVIANA